LVGFQVTFFVKTSIRTFVLLLASQPSLFAQSDVTYPDVAAVLSGRCVMCHSGPAAPLQLRLDSYEAVLQGSSRGAIVQPGSADDSELIRRLTGASQPRMPMTGPPYLTEDEIARFVDWINGGLLQGTEPQQAVAENTPPPIPLAD